MAKIQNTYYTRRGASPFPLPGSGGPYVYLQSLLQQNGVSFRVGDLARTQLDAEITNIQNHGMENSLDFLQKAISIQRSHELSFIQTRLNDFKKLGLMGSEELEIQQALETMSKNGPIDYKMFIKGLNTAITNLQHYKTRVQAFLTTAVTNIPQVRMVENLATTIGSYADSRYALYYSQEEAIRQLAFKWINTRGQDFIQAQIAAGVEGGKNIAAALAMITQQMARYIYDTRQLKERHISAADKKGKFADFHSVDEFAKFINKIDLNDFEKYTNISSILKDNTLLKEIQTLYGIDFDSASYANGRHTSTSASLEIRELKSLLGTDPLINEDFKDILNSITIKWDGHSPNEFKLALQNELVSGLSFDSHAHIGSYGGATDMLLGYVSGSISLNKDNGEVGRALQSIAARLKNEHASNDSEKISKIYLEELEKLNDQLEGLSKSFVLHETTKNYNTLEKGAWSKNMNSFSGRNMNLFNYLSQVNSFGSKIGLNMNSLSYIAYNLATDAIGSINKEPLEHLLALFAGIMMFDDFTIIGQEITDDMQFSNVENIHLYRLQDTYFPASMFLDATYQAMQQVKDELLAGNGFTVDISVPTINYYGQNWDIPFEQRWDVVREQARKGTSISLHFAANFLSLMASLF